MATFTGPSLDPATGRLREKHVPAYLTQASQNASFATVLASNGTADQTVRINAALAAGSTFGVRKTVRLVGDFIFTKLVIPSNTTLDMRDAKMSQVIGTQDNLLVNAAVVNNTRTIYAAMTSGSAVLTAAATNESIATAPFAASDVGRRVIVQGAGIGGKPLDTTISGFTSASSVTLAAAASTTVSGQYAAVGDRDQNITVLGGLWDRQSSGLNGSYLAHIMRFRHVDGLTISDGTIDSNGGKYAIGVGDCTRFAVQNIGGPRQGSDVVHVNGPASNGRIANIVVASIHDDLISLTAGDSTGGANRVRDTAGDITDIVVDTGLYQVSTYTSSCLKIIAGKTMDNSASYAVRDIRARNLTGPDTNGAVVFIGDSSGGTFDDMLVDGVRSLGGSSKGCVIIQGGNSIDRLVFRNLVPDPNDAYAVSVGASVGKMEVSGVKLTATSGAPNGVLVAGGTISRLLLHAVQGDSPSGSALRINNGAAVTNAIFSKVTVENGFNCITTSAGSTLGNVSIASLASVGTAYPIGVLQSLTTLSATGYNCSGVTAMLWAQGGGAVTLAGMIGTTDNDTVLGTVNIAAASSLNSLNKDPDRLNAGEETIARLMSQGSPQLSTGQLILSYFTARRTETINNINTVVLGTAAAGTTLARVGIYSVASNGDLTLVASTANDTTLWNTTFSGASRALSASWSKVAGQRYALGVLFVGTTGPKLSGVIPVNGAELARSPRLAGSIAAQADLPGNISNGIVTGAQGITLYGALLP